MLGYSTSTYNYKKKQKSLHYVQPKITKNPLKAYEETLYIIKVSCSLPINTKNNKIFILNFEKYV